MVDKGPGTSETLSPEGSSSIPSSPARIINSKASPEGHEADQLPEKPSPHRIPLVRFTPSASPWRKDSTDRSSPIPRPPLSIVSSRKSMKTRTESESRLLNLLRSKSKVGNFHNLRLGKGEMPQISRSHTTIPEFISTNKSLRVRSGSLDNRNDSSTAPSKQANKTFIANVKQLLQNDKLLGAKTTALKNDVETPSIEKVDAPTNKFGTIVVKDERSGPTAGKEEENSAKSSSEKSAVVKEKQNISQLISSHVAEDNGGVNELTKKRPSEADSHSKTGEKRARIATEVGNDLPKDGNKVPVTGGPNRDSMSVTSEKAVANEGYSRDTTIEPTSAQNQKTESSGLKGSSRDSVNASNTVQERKDTSDAELSSNEHNGSKFKDGDDFTAKSPMAMDKVDRDSKVKEVKQNGTLSNSEISVNKDTKLDFYNERPTILSSNAELMTLSSREVSNAHSPSPEAAQILPTVQVQRNERKRNSTADIANLLNAVQDSSVNRIVALKKSSGDTPQISTRDQRDKDIQPTRAIKDTGKEIGGKASAANGYPIVKSESQMTASSDTEGTRGTQRTREQLETTHSADMPYATAKPTQQLSLKRIEFQPRKLGSDRNLLKARSVSPHVNETVSTKGNIEVHEGLAAKCHSQPAPASHQDKNNLYRPVLDSEQNHVTVIETSPEINTKNGNHQFNGRRRPIATSELRRKWNIAVSQELPDDAAQRKKLVDLFSVFKQQSVPKEATQNDNTENHGGLVVKILNVPEVQGQELYDGKRAPKTRSKQHPLTEKVVAADEQLPSIEEKPIASEDSSSKLELHYLTEPESSSSDDEEPIKDTTSTNPSKVKEGSLSSLSGLGIRPIVSRDKETTPRLDPIIERRKINRQLAQDVLNRLPKGTSYAKDTICQLIEGGIVPHSAIASDSKVSVTNNVCSENNYEQSHVYYYQQMHKRGDLEFIPLNGPLSVEFQYGIDPSSSTHGPTLPSNVLSKGAPKVLILPSSQMDKRDSPSHLRDNWKRTWLQMIQGCLVYVEVPQTSEESEELVSTDLLLRLKVAFVNFGAKMADHLDDNVSILVTPRSQKLSSAPNVSLNGDLRVWSVKKACQFLRNLGANPIQLGLSPEAEVLDSRTDWATKAPTEEKDEKKADSTERDQPSLGSVSKISEHMEPKGRRSLTAEPELPESKPNLVKHEESVSTPESKIIKAASKPFSLESDTRRNSTGSPQEASDKSSDLEISDVEEIDDYESVQQVIQDATNALEAKDRQIDAAKKIILALSREVMKKELSITSLTGRLKAAEQEIKQQKQTLDDYAVALVEKELELMEKSEIQNDATD